MVTTSVPGHHRPGVTKQLKCQKRCITERPERGEIPSGWRSGGPFKMRQSRAVCGGGELALTPDSTAVRVLICGPDESCVIHPQHSQTKPAPLRNLGNSPGVSQSAAASQRAKTKLPIIYTANDFVLIRLHGRRAGTISISVTGRERVGRNISPNAATRGSQHKSRHKERR